jgi:hypothetical protein
MKGGGRDVMEERGESAGYRITEEKQLMDDTTV